MGGGIPGAAIPGGFAGITELLGVGGETWDVGIRAVGCGSRAQLCPQIWALWGAEFCSSRGGPELHGWAGGAAPTCKAAARPRAGIPAQGRRCQAVPGAGCCAGPCWVFCQAVLGAGCCAGCCTRCHPRHFLGSQSRRPGCAGSSRVTQGRGGGAAGCHGCKAPLLLVIDAAAPRWPASPPFPPAGTSCPAAPASSPGGRSSCSSSSPRPVRPCGRRHPMGGVGPRVALRLGAPSGAGAELWGWGDPARGRPSFPGPFSPQPGPRGGRAGALCSAAPFTPTAPHCSALWVLGRALGCGAAAPKIPPFSRCSAVLRCLQCRCGPGAP